MTIFRSGKGQVVVKSAEPVPAVPADADVRSRVHEDGRGAFAVAGGRVFYANFADQRLCACACLACIQGAPPLLRWFVLTL